MEKNEFFKKAIFCITHLFREATFSKEVLLQLLPFQKSYLFTTYFFRRVTISELHFLSTATLHIYQLVIKWAQYQLRTVEVWEFFLVYLLLLKVTSQTEFTQLVGYCGTSTFWWNYFLNKLLFQSFYFLRTPTFSKQLYFLVRATFSEGGVFLNS